MITRGDRVIPDIIKTFAADALVSYLAKSPTANLLSA